MFSKENNIVQITCFTLFCEEWQIELLPKVSFIFVFDLRIGFPFYWHSIFLMVGQQNINNLETTLDGVKIESASCVVVFHFPLFTS